MLNTPVRAAKLQAMVLVFTAAWLNCLISGFTAETVPVRLVRGPTDLEGIVEVYYNSTWGTVCDDEIDRNDNGCLVICAQLGHTSGSFVKKAPTIYGSSPADSIIWLDGVRCQGTEEDLNWCLHEHWGVHDCSRNEDFGCRCERADNFSDMPPGSCDSVRHRISPFDPKYPGIGRAEVQDDGGQWHLICDDYWDNVDAAVFCRCLGYTDETHFRAYWSPELINMNPAYDTAYDSVHCTVADMSIIQNIWGCETVPSSGKCGISEAAAVACIEVPSYVPPQAPNATVECNGDTINLCYISPDFSLYQEHIDVSPSCKNAVTSNVTNGICIEVPMHDCTADEVTSDYSEKHYCYNIMYSEPTALNTITTANMWGNIACCSVAKNGTVSSNFQLTIPESSTVHSQAALNFSIGCYANDSFEGDPLELPFSVSRGQELFCKVSAATYDPKFRLIVPDCKFMALPSGVPSYQFLEDKCPTSKEFALSYYNFDAHNWGFKFRAPKFQGYESLYLTCDSYVCDPSLSKKPYCDRSCTSARTKRSAENQLTPKGWASRKVTEGPFMMSDSSKGPLLSSKGRLIKSVRLTSGCTPLRKHDFIWVVLTFLTCRYFCL